ncbi:MAG: tetratricopeptide repeat protein [candidate division Zixibacteria bacterium]|nr:tetratricopeptide repeat protein [candidate division Zixibacteria bacterium]
MNKKTILGLSLIITLIGAGFLIFASCSTNNSKSIRFGAEKLLDKAERIYSTANINPDLNNKEFITEIKRGYFEVINYCEGYFESLPAGGKYPKEYQEMATVAFRAANRLSNIFYSEKQYDSSLLVLNQLLSHTQLQGRALLTTRMNMAITLQTKGDWAPAMKIYHSIIDAFFPPVDNQNNIIPQVLNLPIEIVRINQFLGDSNTVKIETQSAKNYYLKLLSDWPNSALAIMARSNLARLYSDNGEWDKAIENLRFLRDSTGKIDFEAALMIADITYGGKKNHSEAIRIYDSLITQTKDTAALAIIYIRKGIAYFDIKDYARCRATMLKIKEFFPRYFQANPLPQHYIALSLASEEKWPLAENEFRWLADNYSATEQAFNAYLIIAEHYKATGDKNMADTWYRRAEEFYDKIGRQYPGSNIEASAISYRAEIARGEQKWDTAIKFLQELYHKFPQTDAGQRALLNAAAVYREKLNNPLAADSLTNRLKMELLPVSDSGIDIK